MSANEVILKNPERFAGEYTIPKQKLVSAIETALDKIEENLDKFGADKYVNSCSVNFRYSPGENNNWVCGMNTALYWLAYEFTGNKKFYDAAKIQSDSFRPRLDNRVCLGTHDVGFTYSPSCVSAYKITGEESYRQTALDAAQFLYDVHYSKKGGFIVRAIDLVDNEIGCRTMMDSLMNSPLLFWAGKELGKKELTDAAISQYEITRKHLIRDDYSSFHHFQFEPGTHKPVRGLTFQGYSDDSCWSRGQAWGVYGFPISYSYTKDESLIDLHKNVTYYMLNHLPDDFIPYWDFVFTSGDEPRDSSAAAISVCGMLEMCKHLPDTAEHKQVFKTASAKILESLIDNYSGCAGIEGDGLIFHVAGAVPQKIGLDECAMYGDMYYLEALMRTYNPDWEMYW